MSHASVEGHHADVKLSLLRAASVARKLNQLDIVSWQLNNIGYDAIQEFKRRTDYDTRMRIMRTLKCDAQRREYAIEMRKIFSRQLELITLPSEYLNDALEYQSVLDQRSRMRKIKSNLKFVYWVQQFTASETVPPEGQ